MIRVGILDDHPVAVLELRSALESVPDIRVVSATSDATDLAPATLDLLLVDLHLGSDLPCVATIRQLALLVPVLLISASDDVHSVEAGLAAGARAFVHKRGRPQEYVDAVRKVAGAVVSQDGKALSPREQAIVELVEHGLTHEQIGRRLLISRHTVDTYVKRARAKLGAGNKADLTRAAMTYPRLAA